MSRELSHSMNRRALLASMGAVAGASLVTSAHAASGIVVIVHPGNSETPSSSDVAAIFTTRRQTWKNGSRIVPFNFPARQDTRVKFDRSALGMDPDDVARYWIDRRIRGGNPPPKQVGNGTLIVRLVGRMTGAIGYVPRSMATSAVRIIGEV